jgi:hypothetical protein
MGNGHIFHLHGDEMATAILVFQQKYYPKTRIPVRILGANFPTDQIRRATEPWHDIHLGSSHKMLQGKIRALIYPLVLVMCQLYYGTEGTTCQHDSYLRCGEQLLWNDTLNPSSAVLEIRLPTSLPYRWSAYLSTCHENTTASTSIKLFDHCPLSEGQHPKSPVASNSRDRSCTLADRASTLEYFSHQQRHHYTSDNDGGGNNYYVVVTAGGADGPEAGSVYKVSLFLSCRDERGLEFGGSWNNGIISDEIDESEEEEDDENKGKQSVQEAGQRRTRSITEKFNANGNIKFARRLAATPAPTLTVHPSIMPSNTPTSTSSLTPGPSYVPTLLSNHPSELPSGAPTILPSSAPTLPPSLVPTSTSPTSIPSANPSASSFPTDIPTSAPTFAPSLTMQPTSVPTIDVCKYVNISCGVILAGDTTGQYDYMNAVAGELMYLMRAVSARRLFTTVCPTVSGFLPQVRVYDGCPNEAGNVSQENCFLATIFCPLQKN